LVLDFLSLSQVTGAGPSPAHHVLPCNRFLPVTRLGYVACCASVWTGWASMQQRRRPRCSLAQCSHKRKENCRNRIFRLQSEFTISAVPKILAIRSHHVLAASQHHKLLGVQIPSAGCCCWYFVLTGGAGQRLLPFLRCTVAAAHPNTAARSALPRKALSPGV